MAQATTNPQVTCFASLPTEIRLSIWEILLPKPRIVHVRQRKLKKTIGEWESQNNTSWPNNYHQLIHNDSRTLQRWNTIEAYQNECRENLRRDLCAEEDDLDAYKRCHLLAYTSDQSAPNVTFVCRETFELVSKHYSQILQATGSNAQIWFNYKIDTLYFTRTYCPTDLQGSWHSILSMIQSGFTPIDIADVGQKVERLAASSENFVASSTLVRSYESWIARILDQFKHLDRFIIAARQFEDRKIDPVASTPVFFVDESDIEKFLLRCHASPHCPHGLAEPVEPSHSHHFLVDPSI